MNTEYIMGSGLLKSPPITGGGRAKGGGAEKRGGKGLERETRRHHLHVPTFSINSA